MIESSHPNNRFIAETTVLPDSTTRILTKTSKGLSNHSEEEGGKPVEKIVDGDHLWAVLSIYYEIHFKSEK